MPALRRCTWRLSPSRCRPCNRDRHDHREREDRGGASHRPTHRRTGAKRGRGAGAGDGGNGAGDVPQRARPCPAATCRVASATVSLRARRDMADARRRRNPGVCAELGGGGLVVGALTPRGSHSHANARRAQWASRRISSASPHSARFRATLRSMLATGRVYRRRPCALRWRRLAVCHRPAPAAPGAPGHRLGCRGSRSLRQ
jgi:hypothetical protein